MSNPGITGSGSGALQQQKEQKLEHQVEQLVPAAEKHGLPSAGICVAHQEDPIMTAELEATPTAVQALVDQPQEPPLPRPAPAPAHASQAQAGPASPPTPASRSHHLSPQSEHSSHPSALPNLARKLSLSNHILRTSHQNAAPLQPQPASPTSHLSKDAAPSWGATTTKLKALLMGKNHPKSKSTTTTPTTAISTPVQSPLRTTSGSEAENQLDFSQHALPMTLPSFAPVNDNENNENNAKSSPATTNADDDDLYIPLPRVHRRFIPTPRPRDPTVDPVKPAAILNNNIRLVIFPRNLYQHNSRQQDILDVMDLEPDEELTLPAASTHAETSALVNGKHPSLYRRASRTARASISGPSSAGPRGRRGSLAQQQQLGPRGAPVMVPPSVAPETPNTAAESTAAKPRHRAGRRKAAAAAVMSIVYEQQSERRHSERIT